MFGNSKKDFLSKILEIKGCIITMDALGTQKKIAKTILEQEADYIMAVELNSVASLAVNWMDTIRTTIKLIDLICFI